VGKSKKPMIPPLSKSIPAAVQELVLLCFQENHLIISGEIPPSDYSDISNGGDIRASDYSTISSLGRRSGGAKPRERPLLLLF
jgi:hypothetical protein